MFAKSIFISLLTFTSLAIAKPNCCPESITKGGAIRFSYAEKSIFEVSKSHYSLLAEAFDYWAQVCNEGQEFSTGPLFKYDTGNHYNVRLESSPLGKLNFKVTQAVSDKGFAIYTLTLNSNLNFDANGFYEAAKDGMEQILIQQKARN